ncbi:MAG: hypothetical protein J2P22_18560, partial [Nocardioides sp.]|nr:hypothetical protein [Nocardioides sp.]
MSDEGLSIFDEPDESPEETTQVMEPQRGSPQSKPAGKPSAPVPESGDKQPPAPAQKAASEQAPGKGDDLQATRRMPAVPAAPAPAAPTPRASGPAGPGPAT